MNRAVKISPAPSEKNTQAEHIITQLTLDSDKKPPATIQTTANSERPGRKQSRITKRMSIFGVSSSQLSEYDAAELMRTCNGRMMPNPAHFDIEELMLTREAFQNAIIADEIPGLTLSKVTIWVRAQHVRSTFLSGAVQAML